jgi:cytochrome c553
MKKILKWMGFVAVGIVGVIAIAFAVVWFESNRELSRVYRVAANAALTIPTDDASIAEGHRLAQLSGCTHCHGENLSNGKPVDLPNIARFVAPNLTKVARSYDDAQFVTLLRHGVKRDGTGALFMPSGMFRLQRDDDLARVIAWVRTLPEVDGITETTQVRPLGRMIVALGQFKTSAREIQESPAAPMSFDAADPLSHGRYIAMNFCTECHGHDLNGVELAHSPPLTVAKGYSPEQFARLMHDGVGTGERTFELMTPTAKVRFSSFTTEEVSALHAYLQSRT